ncbi:MAG: homoserine kinase, partial [Planctomycetes bacterium]|nr:homoserine kinase [Planctomycetota bacterium]
PHIEVQTAEARRMLKKKIELGTAIQQWGNVAGLVAGMMSGDYDLIGRSLQDVVAEPVRSDLIPGFYQVKNAALKAGALGCSISGSGPAVFALSTSGNAAQRIGRAMQDAFLSNRIASDLYISRVNQDGPKVLS